MVPSSIDYLGNQLNGVALTLPRIVAAFAVLPLMTSDTVPALVRNSFYVSLAILVYPLAAAASPSTVPPSILSKLTSTVVTAPPKSRGR